MRSSLPRPSTGQILALLVSVLMVTSMTGSAVAAPTAYDTASDDGVEPRISATVTKAEHTIGSPLAEYQTDSGDSAALPAVKNDSPNNPLEFYPTEIDFSDRDKFPHDKDVSWLNASRWSANGSNSSAISVSETSEDVSKLEIATNGSLGSGDDARVEFANVEITSDVNKRVLQSFVDVDSLDSGAEVRVMLVDSDGDHVSAVVSTAASPSDDGVITNTTTRGAVFQHSVGDLAVNGTGDGAMQEIQEVHVEVVDGDATVAISALNADRLDTYELVSQRVPAPDMDDTDTKIVGVDESAGGWLSTYDQATFGASFDGAPMFDVRVPMHFRASDLSDSGDYVVEWSDAEGFPSFDRRAVAYFRLSLPSAYDLSYSDVTVEVPQDLPSGRYREVGVATGIGDSDLDSLEYQDKTSLFSAQGETVDLGASASSGESIAVKIDVLHTSEEYDTLHSSTAGGGAAEESPDGVLDMIFSLPGMIVSGVLGFLGLRKRRG